MRCLLDTHAFLWWTSDDAALPEAARAVIGNVENDCYLSLASCWELAIKVSIGKLRLSQPVERFVTEEMTANGFSRLPIELKHVARVETLPFHHRDPFDRLLIAQALAEAMPIISADETLTAYGVRRIWDEIAP